MYPLDAKLAVQVGLLLLRNNKELEAVLEVTEKQYEEEKSRADVSVEASFSFFKKKYETEHALLCTQVLLPIPLKEAIL